MQTNERWLVYGVTYKLFAYNSQTHTHTHTHTYDVMVIVVGNGHGDTSSNPGQDWLHFTSHYYPWERYESNNSPSIYG